VTETALDPPAIEPGEEATVRATVENGGGAAGERTVTLTADGDPVANETVSLAPNETATVALSGVFETAGEYDLALPGRTPEPCSLVTRRATTGRRTTRARGPERDREPTKVRKPVTERQRGPSVDRPRSRAPSTSSSWEGCSLSSFSSSPESRSFAGCLDRDGDRADSS